MREFFSVELQCNRLILLVIVECWWIVLFKFDFIINVFFFRNYQCLAEKNDSAVRFLFNM